MDEEIETHHHENHRVAAAIQAMADGLPALGIVAAVLGVIKTMGSISEPPEVLGKLIGGALVGTFLGVFRRRSAWSDRSHRYSGPSTKRKQNIISA